MYQLLKIKHDPFPSIVEVTSEFYPLYVKLGYEKVGEGTYKELEKLQLTMVQEYLKTIQ